jgi:hypothetical protein
MCRLSVGAVKKDLADYIEKKFFEDKNGEDEDIS